MNNLYIYCGLPGSGKTYLARKKFFEVGGFFLDDKFSIYDLKEAITYPNSNIFITDPYLCQDLERQAFIKIVMSISKNVTFHWTFFENDFEKALRNIEYRCDGRIISKYALKNFSMTYMIPSEIPVRDIKDIWLAPVM